MAKREDTESMLHIAIVDDHPIVLKGLEEIIVRNVDRAIIISASTGHELLEFIQKDHYDLVILDISLPDIDGLDLLKKIKKEKPKLRILIVSMHPEEEYAIRALRSGAQGYITKRAAITELVGAVRKILAGGRYVSPGAAEQMLLAFETDERAPHERLSDREFQVMCMLGKGKTVREISETIHLSTNTVRTYRLRVLDKIGLKRTNELIHYTVAHRLAD